ncbi:MAG TPA: DJ-1/PfpI family protein, partial [Saprospiraceae bacterium]
KKSPRLSMANTVKDNIRTRQIAFLVANGVEASAVQNLSKKLKAEGAVVHLIANTMAAVIAEDKTVLTPNHSLQSTSSVCFDAVYIPGGKKSIEKLKNEPASIQFVNEAYKHCKTIGFGKQTESFLELTHVKNTLGKDPAIHVETGTGFPKAFIQAVGMHRIWELEAERQNPA